MRIRVSFHLQPGRRDPLWTLFADSGIPRHRWGRLVRTFLRLHMGELRDFLEKARTVPALEEDEDRVMPAPTPKPAPKRGETRKDVGEPRAEAPKEGKGEGQPDDLDIILGGLAAWEM